MFLSPFSRAGFFLLLSVITLAGAAPAAQTPFPQPQASSREQYLLELINAARANPAAEGRMLASLTDPVILYNYKAFGVSTTQLVSDFNGYAAKPPLAFNANLMASALAHSNDMAATGVQGHNSADGTTFDKRITSFGYKWSSIGENVFGYSENAFFGHVCLIVDWGVPTLGHRVNVLNLDASMPNFREIGISCVDCARSDFGPLVITQDFGTPQDAGLAYVTGVVYQDLNGNGVYDEGEGLGGVSITPDGGNYYAVSTAAGGFTIPLPASGQGSLSLTASGGSLGDSQTKTVAYVAGTNVKADFVSAATVPLLSTVTVSTVTPDAVSATQPGQFMVARTGDTTSTLPVSLKYAGQPKPGVDYNALPATVTIPAGQTSVTLDVVPIAAARSTVLKLKISAQANASYQIGANANGKPAKAKIRVWPAS